jgi:hypothetical protein
MGRVSIAKWQVAGRDCRYYGKVGAIMPLLSTMSKDDYQYLGADKTISDDCTIVFWHRADDRQIRAIYNDLTVVVIRETDLPESK